MKVLLTEFDEKKYLKMERRDAFQEGREEGREEKLRELINKKLQKGKTLEVIAEELETDVEHIKMVLK